MSKLKAIIITDGFGVARWQKEALDLCRDMLDIALVVSCTNTRIKRRPIKHCLYYVLNLSSMRGPAKESRTLEIDGRDSFEFESLYEGLWQVLPTEVVNRVNAVGADVVIKFGMNLLKDPQVLDARFGVVSFHHGDPDRYRGRPAGFYETLNGEARLGIIVQRLSNRLDGGDIYAMGFSKIFHHSYKRTLANAYSNSVPLLRKALLNARQGRVQRNSAAGKNYTLPSNLLMSKFLLTVAARKMRRLAYGAFVEKRWNITVIDSDAMDHALSDGITENLMLKPEKPVPIDRRYSFYADAFFAKDSGDLVVEALNKRTGLGEIVTIDPSTLQIDEVLLKGRHYSYPQTILRDEGFYLLPEVASWSSPYLLKLHDGSVVEEHAIEGLERYRLVDGTLFEKQGTFYLFASKNDKAHDNLDLFCSESLAGPYTEHPCNPIVIDPTCARMGGEILQIDRRLFRFGQNNSFGYGNGLWACEILKIDSQEYLEEKRFEVRVDENRFGPHTINRRTSRLVFDFYEETFALLAGYRRFAGLIARR